MTTLTPSFVFPEHGLSEREVTSGPICISGTADVASGQVVRHRVGQVEFLVRASQETPRWLELVLTRVAEILSLRRDWDSCGAAPISPSTAMSALVILTKVMAPDTPPPNLVPGSMGSVAIEWHTSGYDLEIDIQSRGRSSVYVRDVLSGEEREYELGPDLTRLTDDVARLM